MPRFTSLQEVFDTVARHLLTQMRQSRSIGAYGCLYRGDNGLKCAIGCLIPDEMMPRVHNQDCVPDIWHVIKELFPPEVDCLYLQQLQLIHDGHEPTQWAECLKMFAEQHQLKFNPPAPV